VVCWSHLAIYTPDIINITKDLSRKRIEWTTENLRLNNNDIVALVTNKSEEEGQKDIENIINTSPYEESWLFLPEVDKWYEIGIKRFAEIDNEKGIMVGQDSDSDYVMRILNDYKGKAEINILRPNIYHNHPKPEIVRADIKPKNNLPKDYVVKKVKNMQIRQPITKCIIRHVFMDYLNAKPSIKDLDALIFQTIITAEKFPEINWTFKIQSKYGITEYFLTDEGVEYFRSIDHYEDILGTGAVATYDKDEIQLKSQYLNINFYPKEKKLEEKVDVFNMKKDKAL